MSKDNLEKLAEMARAYEHYKQVYNTDTPVFEERPSYNDLLDIIDSFCIAVVDCLDDINNPEDD